MSGLRLGRFQRDVLWNMAGFGVMAVCGVLLNVIIGVFYGRAALGIFNQVWAVYIFFSQFAVLGIHYSVLRRAAEHVGDPRTCSAVIAGALAPTIALSLLCAALFFLSRPLVGRFMDSPGTATGMAWACAGLFFFAVNKVLLGAINGLRWMRTFAALQALRYILMIAALVGALLVSLPGQALPVVFSVSEAVLFMAATLTLVGRGYLNGPFHGWGVWCGRHLSFGVRSFAAGVMVELNTRVDVLMLGYYASDSVVGVYSFAAALAEGVFQLLVVLRNNYNPRLVRYYQARSLEKLRQVIRTGKLVTYAMMAVVGVLAVGLYPLGTWLVGAKAKFMSAWPLFATLVGGITLSSGYMPFSNILLVTGNPGSHTLLILLTVLSNIIGNAILIPFWGAQGAATATALSYLAHAVALAVLTRIRVRVIL